MEEKTEKTEKTERAEKGDRKKHGKKKHFSGKQKEGRQQQQKRPPEKNPQESRNLARGGKRQNSEEKKEERPERSEKYKRDPEETIFDFTWGDAWGLYGVGYHVVIKDNKDRMYLSWSVDLKYGEMKIGNRVQEFLEDMKACGLQKWDGRRYTKPGILDGDTWSVKVNSLVIKAESQGTNEYPDEWKDFLKCLHEKWTVPVSKREQWE